jgi:lipoate-protein ligase A
MAVDQALLERAEQLDESWLRLYTWKPHCLSFGRHEPAARRYDRERIAALDIDTVRRPTGGRAVWHSRELTYAVAVPCRYLGTLQEAYLEIHRVLAEALMKLGVPASLAPRAGPMPLDGGACFARPAGGEVMAGTRKMVGSAQLRRGGALLQQGSILLADDQQLVAALTTGTALAPPSAHSPLAGALALAEVTEAVTRAFQARWPAAWQKISDSDALLQAASEHYPQFRSRAWTWER